MPPLTASETLISFIAVPTVEAGILKLSLSVNVSSDVGCLALAAHPPLPSCSRIKLLPGYGRRVKVALSEPMVAFTYVKFSVGAKDELSVLYALPPMPTLVLPLALP